MCRNILQILLLALLFSACTSSLKLTILHPADITLPPHIKKVAVVNRTIPDKTGGKILDILEGAVTGEGIGMDQDGKSFAMRGLREALNNNPRLVATQTTLELARKERFSMPEAMVWNDVEKICEKYKADALVVLEEYDTDVKIEERSDTVTTKDKESGEEVKKVEHSTSRETKVKVGWRIYDPVEKDIVDELSFKQAYVDQSKSPVAGRSYQMLPDKRGTANDVSYLAGETYALRITPFWTDIKRYYYNTGNDYFEQAESKVRLNDWESARNLWQKVLSNPGNNKNGKRAAHNIALSYEAEGDIERAIQWANKSVYTYGNKKDKSYLRSLESRKADIELVKIQMEGIE